MRCKFRCYCERKRRNPVKYKKHMHIPPNILQYIKYAGAALVLVVIVLAPAWLARQTKKDKWDMGLIRCASWLFGWTGVGWLWALWWAVRK